MHPTSPNSKMSSPATILLFIFLFLTTTTAAVNKTPTLPEWLEEYLFPDILLPTDVKSYTLNKETGEFKVNLRSTIDISTSDSDGFHLMYKSTIRGVMSKDMSSVTKLEAVSAKVGVSWADIQEITRIGEGGDIDSFLLHIVGGDTGTFLKSLSPTGYALTKLHRGWRLCTKVLGFVKEKMKWSL
ncbi:hypothetical protein L1987_42266 [Smallanthus sonchifolius]|uniref:Uncharacterized protein n=1 Tax=Smallanthus sonchifolius TaxID=185202 RepID=A0ACB9GX31_9ASTR|nr:hypothetical protein L1987_42266 [Smallanthus sonchifolius]